jgi:hypothetical protein
MEFWSRLLVEFERQAPVVALIVQQRLGDVAAGGLDLYQARYRLAAHWRTLDQTRQCASGTEEGIGTYQQRIVPERSRQKPIAVVRPWGVAT